MDNSTIVVVAAIGAVTLTRIVDSIASAYTQRRRPRHETD